MDKIVQLPFTIPPIYQDSISDYVTPLLPRELFSCRKLLVEGLNGNPRELKRFINTLIFNHELSKESNIEDYSPSILATVLLLQHFKKDLYKIISNNPSTLLEYIETKDDGDHGFDQFLKDDLGLKGILKNIQIKDERILGQYLYQTRLLSSDSKTDNIQLESTLSRHKLWIESGGESGERANVSAISIFETNLSRNDFTQAVFEWSKLDGSDFSYCKFNDANLNNVEASECVLSSIEARSADFSSGKFIKSICRNSSFDGSIFVKADFSMSELIDTNFIDCNCSYIRLEGTTLTGSRFIRTSLNGANLKGVNLSKVEIIECSFERANFTASNIGRKDFSNSNFSNSILYKAKLGGSDFSGADLSYSNIQGADMEGADLTGGILIGADLRNTKGLNVKKLENSVYDETTMFDEEILAKLHSHSNWYS